MKKNTSEFLEETEKAIEKGLCTRCGKHVIKSKGFCATCYNLNLIKTNPKYAKYNKDYQKVYQKDLRAKMKKEDSKWMSKRAKFSNEYRNKYPDKFYFSLAKSATKRLSRGKINELIKFSRSLLCKK